MIRIRKLKLARVVAMLPLIVILAASASTHAAGYPDKPVRIVITTTAGGQADVVARTLAAKLSEKLGAQFVVDAKPGANGIIATEHVAKATSDGYTLLMATGSHAINPAVYSRLPFDAKRDFAPIALVVPPGPLVLLAHPSVAANSVGELLALAKGRSNAFSYGSAGVGNTSHLGGEMLQQLTGIKFTHAPYKGMSQAVNDLVAGHIQLMFNPWPVVEGFVKEGKLKVLAQSGASRAPSLPNIPTLAEAGVKDFDLTGWYVLLAPAGTPTDIVSALNKAVIDAMTHADTQAKLASLGSGPPLPLKPAEVAAFVVTETSRMERVAKAASISLETPR